MIEPFRKTQGGDGYYPCQAASQYLVSKTDVACYTMHDAYVKYAVYHHQPESDPLLKKFCARVLTASLSRKYPFWCCSRFVVVGCRQSTRKCITLLTLRRYLASTEYCRSHGDNPHTCCKWKTDCSLGNGTANSGSPSPCLPESESCHDSGLASHYYDQKLAVCRD